MKSYIGAKIIQGQPMNKHEFYMNIKGQDCKMEGIHIFSRKEVN